MKAYPFLHKDPTSGLTRMEEGLDLRDWFAGLAMQGLLSNPKLAEEIRKQGGSYSGWIEDSAYSWADAMMKARENKEVPNE
jgi:hypothetical protein